MKLTDTERVTIHDAIAAWFNDEGPHNLNDHVCPAVERLIAARLAEQREAIRVALIQQANTAWGEHNAAADDGCINAATEHGHAAETWEAAATLVREYQPGEDT